MSTSESTSEFKSLLLVDLAIGRFEAEALVIASLSETVLTQLIDTKSEQGRQDIKTCLDQFSDLGPFRHIGIASNGPEIPVVFVDCVDLLYKLIHTQEEGKKTHLHFFGSNTRTNNGCARLIKSRLHNKANLYVSMDRTGNSAQHGNWDLHELDGVVSTKGVKKTVDIAGLYFDIIELSKIPLTFETVDDTRLSRQRRVYCPR